MTDNIEKFLKQHYKAKNLGHQPIVVHWLKSHRMEQELADINRYVGDLINRGGIGKLKQWFLAGDENFNAITAERYILAYLQQRNGTIEDNLKPEGIDGILKDENGPIGIEITSLNGFIGDWIFVERLTEFLDESSHGSGYEITYSYDRICREQQGKRIYEYIEKTGKAILSNDRQAFSELGLSITPHSRGPGISFEICDSDNIPWFRYITEDLQSKLMQESKVQQLKRQNRNIVFVGLNQSSPCNWAFPRIFEDLAHGEIHYASEIQEIRAFWTSNMAGLTNVIGICYFFYSLPREVPFYPLKFFWRSESDKIAINL